MLSHSYFPATRLVVLGIMLFMVYINWQKTEPVVNM